jgi:hypothetical protein
MPKGLSYLFRLFRFENRKPESGQGVAMVKRPAARNRAQQGWRQVRTHVSPQLTDRNAIGGNRHANG